MPTVDNRERELFFGEQIRSPLLKCTFDFDCAKAPRNGACDSHKADHVLMLDGF